MEKENYSLHTPRKDKITKEPGCIKAVFDAGCELGVSGFALHLMWQLQVGAAGERQVVVLALGWLAMV